MSKKTIAKSLIPKKGFVKTAVLLMMFGVIIWLGISCDLIFNTSYSSEGGKRIDEAQTVYGYLKSIFYSPERQIVELVKDIREEKTKGNNSERLRAKEARLSDLSTSSFYSPSSTIEIGTNGRCKKEMRELENISVNYSKILKKMIDKLMSDPDNIDAQIELAEVIMAFCDKYIELNEEFLRNAEKTYIEQYNASLKKFNGISCGLSDIANDGSQYVDDTELAQKAIAENKLRTLDVIDEMNNLKIAMERSKSGIGALEHRKKLFSHILASSVEIKNHLNVSGGLKDVIASVAYDFPNLSDLKFRTTDESDQIRHKQMQQLSAVPEKSGM